MYGLCIGIHISSCRDTIGTKHRHRLYQIIASINILGKIRITDGCIIKDKCIYTMVFTIEESGNTYVVLFRSAKHQITSGTDKMNICCFKSFKVHSVRVFIHMVVIDSILTEAFAEDIGIRTAAAIQVIITCTADQSVVAVFSG